MCFKRINSTNKLTFSRHRQNAGTHRHDVKWTARWLRKDYLISGWCFLGRRLGLLKVAIRAPSNEAMGLWAPRKKLRAPGHSTPSYSLGPCLVNLLARTGFENICFSVFLHKVTSIYSQNWSREEIPSSQNSDKAGSLILLCSGKHCFERIKYQRQ